MSLISSIKNSFKSRDVAIDLGTSSVLVYVEDKGIVLTEPSVVAIDTRTDKIIKVGSEAQALTGRTDKNTKTLRPLQNGVVAQYEITYKMLNHFLHRASGDMFFNPRVMICVPGNISDVERRAVMDAAYEAGAKSVYMICEPLAAAIGAGLKIDAPRGQLVVDIGGGTTDIAVISMRGIVEFRSIKCGGDAVNAAIISYIEKKYNIIISDRIAENIKLKIGKAYADGNTCRSLTLVGNGKTDGIPKEITLTSDEMPTAVRPAVDGIVDGIKSVIGEIPAELIPDIIDYGMTLTGYGSLLPGIDRALNEITGIPVKIAQRAGECVVMGEMKALSQIAYDTDDENNPRLV